MAPWFVNDDLDRILKEKFITEFRKGYVTVEGVCLPERFEKFARAIEDFEVRDDDIWVCSFPKTGTPFFVSNSCKCNTNDTTMRSGTTWTQEMIWCIGNDLDFEGAKLLLAERFPFLE